MIAVVAGWGFAQSPDILPGLPVSEAAAADNVIIGLLVSIAIGMLILIPSLLLLYGLVLGGRFDPGSDQTELTQTRLGPMTELTGPGKRPVLGVLALAGVGALLSVAFSSGAPLYIGIVMVLTALVTGCVMLAVTLVTAENAD